MKWLLFTGALVAGLVALGALAVDEPDIVWEGRSPICPHCRSTVPMLAQFCSHCDRSFDWVVEEEPCRWCLSSADVDYLKDLFAEVGADSDPLPGKLGSFPVVYFRSIDEGVCGYCAGGGETMEAGAEVPCPVCRGYQKCIACAGDRVVEVGSETAHARWVERARVREEAVRRSRVTGLPVKRSTLVTREIEALRGFVEIEKVEDEHGRDLLERALARTRAAFRALDAERQPAVEPADAD